MKSPFLPEVEGDEGCSRFDNFDEEAPFHPAEGATGEAAASSSAKKNKKRKDINFPGYTYKKEVEDQKSKLVQALKGLLNSGEEGAGGHAEGEDDGYQSPPEQEQKIPKQ